MTRGASVGVTTSYDPPVAFTSGWNNHMGGATPTDYFTSDDSKYTVEQKGNELQLVVTPAGAVRKLIDAIPDDPTTDIGRAAVAEARAAYEALTEDQKDQIPQSILKTLTVAEAAIDQADLTIAKSEAQNDLTTYRNGKDDSSYDSDGVAAMNDAKTAGDIAIENAANTDAVATALQNAKVAIDAVKTIAKKKEEADQAAADAVTAEISILPEKDKVDLSHRAKSKLHVRTMKL